MKKKCQVVMLPTEKVTRIFLSDDKESMSQMLYDVKSHNGVNLYILSDEKIQEGDWFILIIDNGSVDSHIILLLKC